MTKVIVFIVFCFLFLLTPVSAAPKAIITSSPSSIQLDSPFDIQVSINGEPNTGYYTKGRIGINSSSLTKGVTYNPNNATPNDWLTDNDSWSNFPVATTDGGGSWTGSLQIKAASSAIIGDNLLVFRIRKLGVTTTYNSDSHTITLSAASTPSPTSTPTPSPSPTSAPIPSPIPSPISNSSTSKTKSSNPTKTPSPIPNSNTPAPSAWERTVASLPAKPSPKIEYHVASVVAVVATATPAAKMEVKKSKKINIAVWIGLILVFAGASSLGYIYLKRK